MASTYSRSITSCACCIVIFLAIILVWVGLFSAFGISNIATPSQRPQKIQAYNADVAAWENFSRAKLLGLTPQPTVKYDNQAVQLHKEVNNVDAINDSPQKDETINSKYAQLRLQSDQIQLFATGAWNPTSTKNIVINTGVEEKQYSLPLMISKSVYMSESKSADRSASCRRMTGYYRGDRECILFYYLSGICALVDSSTGRLALLPGALQPGCGLKNIQTSLDNSYDYSVGEYKKAPAGSSPYSPAYGAMTSNGLITLRDINDPYIQLGYRSGGSFSFGLSQGQQMTIGIILLVVGLLPGAICFLGLTIGTIRHCIRMRKEEATYMNGSYEMVATQPTGETQQPFLPNSYDPQLQQQQPGEYQPQYQPPQQGYAPNTTYAPYM